MAAHKTARGSSQAASAASLPAQPLGNRAAKAAARVAARFATAPSYSEMLAREARAAVDAARAAAKAAEEAQAAFQFVLDGLEVASPAAPDWQLEPLLENNSLRVEGSTAAAPAHAPEETTTAALWQIEEGPRQDESAAHDVVRRYELPGVADADAAEPEEAVQPIYANLIEFPRPIIAARRARPRRAEGPLAASDSAPQLSIFEVDPGAISTAPPPASEDPSAPPSWMRTEWPAWAGDEWQSTPDSDATPLARHAEPAASAADVEVSFASMGTVAQAILDAQTWEELAPDYWPEDEPATQSASAPAIESAPLSRRLLAAVVDGALTAGLLVAAALVAVPHVSQLPGVRVIALSAALALLAAGFAYHACFFTLFRATPGMRYAGIEIDTLSGRAPMRKRRWLRLMAMLLSLAPLGLGFVWALFDDGNLAWHDRLSGTYLRRR